MDSEGFRALQAPLKTRYRDDPEAARRVLRAVGVLGPEELACRVETPAGVVEAGLHPAVGGTAIGPARATCSCNHSSLARG